MVIFMTQGPFAKIIHFATCDDYSLSPLVPAQIPIYSNISISTTMESIENTTATLIKLIKYDHI